MEFACYDSPIENHCGNCRRCLDACPTGALSNPYTLDSSKCLSFLTIENRDRIPDDISPKMGNYIYGGKDPDYYVFYKTKLLYKAKQYFCMPFVG